MEKCKQAFYIKKYIYIYINLQHIHIPVFMSMQVGDVALQCGQIKLSICCFEKASDLSSLLLIYSSLGSREGLSKLAENAKLQSRFNIAFLSFFLLADLDKCIDVLITSGRIPEAALFAKTYCPSKISHITKLWKESLVKSHPIIAQKIADPLEYPDHFSDLILA